MIRGWIAKTLGMIGLVGGALLAFRGINACDIVRVE